MRIALTITELDPGGAENCLVNLACFLAGRGHAVLVLGLGRPPRAGQEKLIRQLDSASIPWRCGGFVGARHSLSAVKWLRAELAAFAPDVVQSMLFHANVLTAWACRGSGFRLLGGVRVRQPQRMRWWLQRLASRGMERVICVSDDVARHCREKERLDPRKIVVIPNGIEPPRLDESPTMDWSQLGLPSEGRIILAVGRLDEQKGIVPLVRDADRLLSAVPRTRLVLMGDGPQRELLKTLSEKLVHRDRVHWVGWQPDPIAWMRCSELLVLPAKYEGMPNVVLEAMAVAKPVVSFAVDGVKQLLGEAELSRPQLVSSGQIVDLIEAVQQLLGDKDLQRRCGEHNRLRVEQCFRLQDQLRKYEALYQSRAI